MTINEKLTNELKKLNSNLGLSQEMLNLVAGVYVTGLTDASTDEEVVAAAANALPMMKSLQSESDRVRTAASKAAEDKYKGEIERLSGKTNPPAGDETPEWAKALISGLNQKNEEMLKEIEKLKGENKQKAFEVMFARVGKDLGFSSEMLDLYKPGLSSDMDEDAVRNKLGALKKAMADSGAKFGERTTGGGSVEANKQAGEAFFEQLKAQREASDARK